MPVNNPLNNPTKKNPDRDQKRDQKNNPRAGQNNPDTYRSGKEDENRDF